MESFSNRRNALNNNHNQDINNDSKTELYSTLAQWPQKTGDFHVSVFREQRFAE